MNLETFDAMNMASVRKNDPTIRVCRKGANVLSKGAIDLTGYEPEAGISFHQDKDNPKDWYFSNQETGFPLRKGYDADTLLFNCTAMSNMILDSLDLDEASVGFKIAPEPTVVGDTTYWAILTAKPIIKKRKK